MKRYLKCNLDRGMTDEEQNLIVDYVVYKTQNDRFNDDIEDSFESSSEAIRYAIANNCESVWRQTETEIEEVWHN